MLGIRLDPTVERALDALARRTHRSKSDIAREVITRHVQRHDEAFLAEARRQSLRAAARGWTVEDEAWEDLAAGSDTATEGEH